MCIHIPASMYECTNKSIYVSPYILYTYARKNTHMHTDAYTYLSAFVYSYVDVCIYIHIYICIYARTCSTSI